MDELSSDEDETSAHELKIGSSSEYVLIGVLTLPRFELHAGLKGRIQVNQTDRAAKLPKQRLHAPVVVGKQKSVWLDFPCNTKLTLRVAHKRVRARGEDFLIREPVLETETDFRRVVR